MKQAKPLHQHLLRVLFGLVGGLAIQALGHSVWIEPAADGQLVARFGEPGEKPETSPGHLDSIAPPVAFGLGSATNEAPRMVDAPRRSDHFALTGLSVTNVACLETAYAVMTTPGKPGRKPLFYARWQPAGAGPATPALTLDLVPTGNSGEVRVYFRGQPLGGIAATLHTPDGKDQELKADGEGFLRFKPGQSGLHHLSIGRHREELGGYHGGLAYAATSHNAALTWVEP